MRKSPWKKWEERYVNLIISVFKRNTTLAAYLFTIIYFAMAYVKYHIFRAHPERDLGYSPHRGTG